MLFGCKLNYVAPARLNDGSNAVFKCTISSAGQAGLAIDLKRVISEPEFEIPLPRFNGNLDKQRMVKTVDQFIELSGFDKVRVPHWLMVKATLAALWSFKDGGSINKPFLQMVHHVSAMR